MDRQNIPAQSHSCAGQQIHQKCRRANFVSRPCHWKASSALTSIRKFICLYQRPIPCTNAITCSDLVYANRPAEFLHRQAIALNPHVTSKAMTTGDLTPVRSCKCAILAKRGRSAVRDCVLCSKWFTWATCGMIATTTIDQSASGIAKALRIAFVR